MRRINRKIYGDKGVKDKAVIHYQRLEAEMVTIRQLLQAGDYKHEKVLKGSNNHQKEVSSLTINGGLEGFLFTGKTKKELGQLGDYDLYTVGKNHAKCRVSVSYNPEGDNNCGFHALQNILKCKEPMCSFGYEGGGIDLRKAIAKRLRRIMDRTDITITLSSLQEEIARRIKSDVKPEDVTNAIKIIMSDGAWADEIHIEIINMIIKILKEKRYSLSPGEWVPLFAQYVDKSKKGAKIAGRYVLTSDAAPGGVIKGGLIMGLTYYSEESEMLNHWVVLKIK